MRVHAGWLVNGFKNIKLTLWQRRLLRHVLYIYVDVFFYIQLRVYSVSRLDGR